MASLKRIGVVLGLFFILGLNLRSLSDPYQMEGSISKTTGNVSEISSLVSQSSTEFLPDNSSWTDYPVDDDRNGYYDRLIIYLGIPKSTDREFGVYGVLNDSEGNLLGISILYRWDIGNEILLSFSGQAINQIGTNGSYYVWVGTFRHYWWYGIEDLQMLFSYKTSQDYDASAFEVPNAKITGISDYGNDTDNDGVFDDIIFEFTVEIKDPGYCNLAMNLDSSTPFADGQVINWGEFLTPEDTSIVIRLDIPEDHVDGPLNVSVRFQFYGIDMQFLIGLQTINSYSVEIHVTSRKFLTGNYWDWGVDTDFDGKFDQLVIKTEVNITLTGNYWLNMHLIASNNDRVGWSNWANHGAYWNEGFHNVSLIFDASLVYSLRNNSISFEVEYVRIRNEDNGLMEEASYAYTTRAYNYTEFDIPRAFATGNFWDSGLDSDSDGKFDQIQIGLEVNITSTGSYTLYMRLFLPDLDQGYWDQYTEYSDYWIRGIHNITLSFDTMLVHSYRTNSTFAIDHLRIRDENYNTLDEVFLPYTTRIYNYTEFDLPDAWFTGNLWTRGIDYESNSKFEVLAFDIEINVSSSGNYRIEIRLEQVEGGFDFWDNQYLFLNEGLHWISFEIDGSIIYRFRVNSSFMLTDSRIIREEYYYWNVVDEGYLNYISRAFSYTEFNPPPAFLTGNYWDRGIDTDEDGKFDEIIIDVEVNITQEDSYRIEISVVPYIPVWDSNFWGASETDVYDWGIYNISVQLYTTLPYSLRLDTAFIIDHISVLNTWGEVDHVNRPYITRQYKFSEFDRPGVILTGNFWDSGADTDSNGNYDSLTFELETNVTRSGQYHIEFYIRSRHWEYSEWQSFDVFFQVGIENISLSIDTIFLYPLFDSTYFIIENVRIYNWFYNLLDRSVTSYITKTYNRNLFDTPPILLTNTFIDRGESTDSDGEFEELRFYIGINVTETDTYRIDVEIELTMWDDYNWNSHYMYTSIIEYLEEGVDISIIVPIDTTSFYFSDQYNFLRARIQSINIYDSADNLCFSDSGWIYESREYYFNDFEWWQSWIDSETSTTRESSDFNLDHLPSWNVPFGIVILFAISIVFYLVQRPRRS
ncbi:MAG: hypothetical protein JSW11_11770 [Candidatus Heimdallarchaeota archaeon]|nr:MAG: hypothetical protein JSW11_11770 [Candidatus Heimdallarchaeota archaeon]